MVSLKNLLLSLLLSGIFIVIYNILDNIKELYKKNVMPVNISKIDKNKLYNISISSDFDYYIGNTSLYKGKKIIFYRFNNNSIITIIKNSHKNDTGIKNNTIYNLTLKQLVKPLNIENLKCIPIDIIKDKDIKAFNISLLIKNKKIKYSFTQDNLFIKELTNSYNSIIQTKKLKEKMYQCNFNIYIYNNFISILKDLPKKIIIKK